MEERLDKIEVMLRDVLEAILDIPRANREYGLNRPSPFSGGAEMNTPKIPNGPDEIPPVWESGIVRELVLLDIPKEGLRWYADLGASVAEIRPFTSAQEAHFLECGKKVPLAYSYAAPVRPLGDWKIIKRVRNPLAPIPPGCRLAADGCTLEDDI